MRQVQERIFTYKELSEKARQKAYELYIENLDYGGIEQDLECELKGLLEFFGINLVSSLTLNYSLSHCQGDGISFTGHFKFQGLDVIVNRSSVNYYHKRSVHFTISNDNDDTPPEDIYTEFQEAYEDLCDHLEKYGYEIIDSYQDESNLEDLEFYEDGGRYYG